MKSNTLIILAVLAVIVTLLTLVVTINKFGVTGKATDTATANFTISSQASISFITNIVNWGTGTVEELAEYCTLDTEGNVANGVGFTSVNQGLTLQNDGNVNITVNLTSSKDADSFIGGKNPLFQWMVHNNESNSCLTGLTPTSYTTVTTTATTVCTNMSYNDSSDTIDIDLKVQVPEDAIGTKGCVITATGTAL